MDWTQIWESQFQTVRLGGENACRKHPELQESIERDIEEFCSQPVLRSFADLSRCSDHNDPERSRRTIQTVKKSNDHHTASERGPWIS